MTLNLAVVAGEREGHETVPWGADLTWQGREPNSGQVADAGEPPADH